MRMILPLLAPSLAGAMASTDAADRIFANGFEPCCTLGGEVVGLSGNGLMQHLAVGAISEDKTITASGGEPLLYTFVRNAPPGSAYTVTISAQPSGQICTLASASGSMPSAPETDINVTCIAGPASLNWDDGSWDDANWN